MGKGFIVLGSVRSAPIHHGTVPTGQPCVFGAYASIAPAYTADAIDISRTPSKPLIRVALEHDGDENSVNLESLIGIAPNTIDGRNGPGLRKWYAQLPFETRSLWDTAKGMRETAGTYVTVLPRGCDDLEDFEETLNGVLPELRAHNGRIQRTGLFKYELNELRERFIQSLRNNDATDELLEFDCLFPVDKGTATKMGYLVDHAAGNVREQDIRKAEKLFEQYHRKTLSRH
jgi:hypothetical protein